MKDKKKSGCHNPQLGVSTNCECGDTLLETLNTIKKAGFKCIMLAEKDSQLSLEESIKLAQSMGLTVSFVHLTSDKTINDLWNSDNENNYAVKRLCESIKILHKYNIKVAVVHASCYGFFDKEPVSGYNSKVGIENMHKVINIAKQCDIKIAVENTLSEIENNDLETLLDNINNNYLGLCYDLGHHILMNPNHDYLERYKERVFAIHIHDNDMNFEAHSKENTGRYGDKHLLPFDGAGDIKTIVRKIAETNYNDAIMLELHRFDHSIKPPYNTHKIYEQLTPIKYLQKAYSRGKKISKIFKKRKNEVIKTNN